MNPNQLVAIVLGGIALALFAAGAWEIRKARQEMTIEQARAAFDHPAGRRLCPPDDDPEFLAWAQRIDPQ